MFADDCDVGVSPRVHDNTDTGRRRFAVESSFEISNSPRDPNTRPSPTDRRSRLSKTPETEIGVIVAATPVCFWSHTPPAPVYGPAQTGAIRAKTGRPRRPVRTTAAQLPVRIRFSLGSHNTRLPARQQTIRRPSRARFMRDVARHIPCTFF